MEEYYQDSFNWPKHMHDQFISFCIENGPTFQNKEIDFRQSARVISCK